MQTNTELLELLFFFSSRMPPREFKMKKRASAVGRHWTVQFGEHREAGNSLFEALTKLKERVEK